MTWDDILIEKKIFDKLSYIIPAVLVIFAAIYFTKVSNTSKLYRYGGHCDSIGYHLDDYCLLSVFDDILSKSPVLMGQLRVIFKYSILRCIS
jgi:miniconductance mechanosensitive channel